MLFHPERRTWGYLTTVRRVFTATPSAYAEQGGTPAMMVVTAACGPARFSTLTRALGCTSHSRHDQDDRLAPCAWRNRNALRNPRLTHAVVLSRRSPRRTATLPHWQPPPAPLPQPARSIVHERFIRAPTRPAILHRPASPPQGRPSPRDAPPPPPRPSRTPRHPW